MKRNILIVDDKPANLVALEHVLGGVKAGIVKASSGEEALKASLNESFALAILDVQMPGMDGYELAGYLRGDPRNALLPIIFLSAVYSDEHHIGMGYEAGAVDFLTKPFQPVHLLAKVRFFLDYDRQQRELAAGKTALESLVAAQQRTNEQLRQEVDHRRRVQEELEKAKDAAESANRAKGFFLANMSHELRTPMNGVIGMLQLLSLAGLTSEQREYVDIAKSSALNLLSLLSEILDLSSIESGSFEFRQEPFDPAEVVTGVVQTLAMEAREKGLVLRDDCTGLRPGCMVGDAGRIRQVLINLVGNSLKFTSRGEVTVEARRIPRPDGLVTLYLCVRDTGSGIPVEQLDHIFQPFTQVDGTYTRRGGGVGLGLNIVKRLVEGMKGQIIASSQLGKGTAMEVALPLDESQAGCPLREEGQPLPDESPLGLNVLVAEDDVVNRVATLKFLEILGCTAGAVEDGDQVVGALAMGRYDLVLMDVSMPRLDGPEAARTVRAARGIVPDPDIPIVAMTAHAMKGDRERFMAQGMNDYITKPVLLDDLRATLERVARGARTGESTLP